MPIEMEDPYQGQPRIGLGNSTLPVRETYSADRRAINENYADAMQNSRQLQEALGQLSNTFKQQGEKQQAQADKVALLQQDATAAGTDLGNNNGPGGVLSRAFPGAGSPDGSGYSMASPGVQATIAHNRGATDAQSFFDKDPDFQSTLANRDLMNNPEALDKTLTQLWNQKAQTLSSPFAGSSNDPLYRGGLASGFMDFKRRVLGQSNSAAITYQREQAVTGAQQYLNSNQDKTSTQQSAFRAVADTGGDPVKLTQYAAIENPHWDNHAVSSNGSVGITQINDARWADIKSDMRKNGQGELADKLTDRTDPYQNAAAWSYEYQRNEKQAEAVLGRKPTTAETYMFWQVPALAGKIISNPDAKVSDVVPAGVIKANPAVYGNGQMSVGDMLNSVNQKMNAGSGYHRQIGDVGTMPRQLVTRDTWQDNYSKWGYKWTDFKNSGQYGGDGQIDRRAVAALDVASDALGRKIPITSAFRSDSYNQAVAGSTHNHQTGDAMDITVTNPDEQRKVITALAAAGVKGIGTYGTHVHFDFATGRPNQQKDVNTWSNGGLPLDEVKAAVDAGRQSAANGGYVRMSGFQGKPIDPTEAKIQTLRTQYGIPPAEGRKMVLQSATQAAANKAYAGDAAGAHEDLSNLRTNYGALSAADELEINKAHQDVNNIQQSLRSRQAAQETFEAQEALNGYIKKTQDQNTANPNALPVPPSQSDFPQTAAGLKAYRDARELGLNITQVPEATSQGNLISAQSDITGDPSAFAKKLGFDDWTKVTPDQMRTAIYTKMPGQFTPDHVNQVMTAYENARRSLPVSQGAAVEASKLYTAEIKQAFEMNTEALHAIASANQGAMATFNDPYRATQEIARYNAQTEAFFRQNYAARYQAAMKDNAGKPLSGDAKDAIAKSALESTRIYGQSLANAVVANKADIGKVSEASFNMEHPQNQFEQEVFSAKKAQLSGQGLVATDIKYPGIPQGTFAMLGKDGKPLKTPDGSYKMLTPSNQVFFFNPSYSVVPQGAAQPTEAPAELQPKAPAADQSQQAAQPDVPPVVQGMADTIDKFHHWLKGQKGVEGSGKAFLDWLRSQSGPTVADGTPQP